MALQDDDSIDDARKKAKDVQEGRRGGHACQRERREAKASKHNQCSKLSRAIRNKLGKTDLHTGFATSKYASLSMTAQHMFFGEANSQELKRGMKT